MTEHDPPASAALQAEGARLRLLYQISRELNSPAPGARLDLQALLPRILTTTARHIGSPGASIIVLDEQGRLANAWVLDDGRLVEPNRDTIALVLQRGLAGWVRDHRQGALVPTTADDGRWVRSPELPRSSGPGSAMAVPLLLPDRVVGVLTVVHPEPGHFDAEDYALISAVADQVTVAVENARLFAAEQLRRRVAGMLAEIAAVVSSSLELTQVLEHILEQIARVVPYDHSAVMLLRGDRLEVAAARPHDPARPNAALATVLPVSRRAIDERRVLIVGDLRTPPALDNGGAAASGPLPGVAPESPSASRSDGLPPDGPTPVRSWISAPLVVQGEAIGAIALGSDGPARYQDDDGQVVAAFASHAAIAVANARLYQDARRQVEYLSFLQDTAGDLTSSLDLHRILEQLLQRVVSVLGVEAGSIGMIDFERDELVFAVAVGGGTPAVQGLRLKLGQGIAGWVAATGEVAVVSDVARDPRWYRAADSRSGFQTRAIVAVPIEVKGRRLGVIEAINPAGGGTFGEADVAMVRSLAGLAGSAITNAQAYAALQAAEDRYAALFEDSVDPILITDMAGTITEANRKACDFLGYERDDLIGMNVNLVHRMGTGLIGEQRLAHVQSGAELIFKTRAWTKTGREVPVEVHANRIRRGGQEFLQWIEHDITERVQLEEMREDLLAMIFHDLRAPLGNVLSSLEMLEAALPRDEGSAVLAPLVEIALRSSQRLSHLLNSLLDLRRLESGQAILDKEPAELLVLVREAVDQIQPTAEARAVALKLDLPPRVPLLLLDADMLRRVLINLLDNAVKYTPPGSRVTVQVGAPPREPLTVAIADEGPGVAAEHEHMIFEKFNRVQREGGPKGLGLGLAFCRLAIEAHGGRIWVESTPGRGATFKFTLPV